MLQFKNKTEARQNFPVDQYSIYTDKAADKAAANYILDTLWAFNPVYLSEQTGLPQKMFKALAEAQIGEQEHNVILLSLIRATCGVNKFCQDAIERDGRGFFLAHYDHNETEALIGNKLFYIYRL
jgi:hypothetical protein